MHAVRQSVLVPIYATIFLAAIVAPSLAELSSSGEGHLFFEAEELLFVSDTSTRTIMAESASGGAFVGIYPSAEELSTSFYLDIDEAGEYEIRTLFAGGRETKIEFTVDGEKLGDEFEVKHRRTVSHGVRRIEPGQIELRYLILNSGVLWLDAIELRRRARTE